MRMVRHFGPVAAVTCLALVAGAVWAAPSTVRTYATEAQCEKDRALRSGLCRTAFANAKVEFEAKAPTFRSRLACFQRFGPCMPWPIGARRLDQFRPQWLGVTVDTATPDGAATPAVAAGKLKLSFEAHTTAALLPAAIPPAEPPPEVFSARHRPGEEDGDAGTPAPIPPRGSGFQVIDGVLTYPAPARFQPKALKKF